MIMGNRTGRIAVLGSLVAAGALCFGAAVAHAVTIDIQNATTSGTSASVAVKLNSQGARVAGTQNDIGYDNTKVSFPVTKTCLRTNTTLCADDSQCPITAMYCVGGSNDKMTCTTITDCPGTGAACVPTHEPCLVRPMCTVAATGKEAFFAYLKTKGCSPGIDPNNNPCTCTPGTDCTAIRAIVASLNIVKPTEITNGTTLYNCQVNLVGGTTSAALVNGDPATETAAAAGAGDPDGNALTTTKGADGTIMVTTGGVGCLGSCGKNCNVTPGNLLTGLDILLGEQDLIVCDHWGVNGASGTDVTPGRLLTGLDNLLEGCPTECVPGS
jgi:hypothetical protein